MSDAPTPQLEQQLAELTTWHGPVPGLWRRALHTADARRPKSGLLGQRLPGWLVGTLAVAALIFLVVMISLPPFEGAREPRHYSTALKTSPRAPETTGQDAGGDVLRHNLATPGHVAGPQVTAGGGKPGRAMRGSEAGCILPPTEATSSEAEVNIERQVVRKATVELKAKDVRAVFLKASQLLSEAQGEFVQDSSLTGEGSRTEANLTLRIAAERLPEVLNELRALGEVRSEKITGEDVTGQVVDLEARLRNEQRVETELLTLLETRKDAPLKEILELRSSISSVRQTIEQLTAQRVRLGRLVALATVLVIVRPADAPPPVQASAWTDFASALGHSVSEGTRFLTRTLAGLVGVAIGGLIWWVLLVAVILTLRAYWHRQRTAG
jgi:hypothetical protein